MNVVVRAAQPQDRSLLARLLAAYLLEFDGSTEPYPYLDQYWSEPERIPLLIEVGRGDCCASLEAVEFRGGRRVAAFHAPKGCSTTAEGPL